MRNASMRAPPRASTRNSWSPRASSAPRLDATPAKTARGPLAVAIEPSARTRQPAVLGGGTIATVAESVGPVGPSTAAVIVSEPGRSETVKQKRAIP
jgi:hypothetical protein